MNIPLSLLMSNSWIAFSKEFRKPINIYSWRKLQEYLNQMLKKENRIKIIHGQKNMLLRVPKRPLQTSMKLGLNTDLVNIRAQWI